MKTRQAFVANSSSSSFVIAYRDISKVEGYDNLPTFAKKIINIALKRISGGDKIETVEQLDKFIVKEWGWGGKKTVKEIIESDDSYEDDYKKYKSYIKKGYIIGFNTVENCDESTQEFYTALPRKENGDGIILIKGDY